MAPLAPAPGMPPPVPAPVVTPATPGTPKVVPQANSVVAPNLPSMPVSQGDIGSEGALTLLSASPSGAWVALCQGEPVAAQLVIGSGPGERIDDVLARDASGRYLVVLQQGKALLIDSMTSARVDLSALGADVRRAKQDYGQHRSLSFDARGEHLAYLRRQGTQTQIVVRALPDGSERTFEPGAGEVFRLRFSPDARYLTFEAIREDTTHNGKLDWPVPEESKDRSACASAALPKLRSYQYLGRGDAVTRAVVSLVDGKVRDLPELVTPLGTRLLVRESDGSLRLDSDGKRTALAPATCAGRVLFADADREQVLVSCAIPKKTGKRAVWLFATGFAKDLQSELYETTTDREAVAGTRLVPLYPGSDASLVDLERREVLPLAAGSRVVQTSNDRALVWRGSDLFSYAAHGKREELVAQGVLKNPDLLQTGDVTLLSPFVVVGASGPALSIPTSSPLALSSTGHVLAGNQTEPGRAATTDGIRGPLHWLDARLPPPDGPPR
jgi:hypothetical protein